MRNDALRLAASALMTFSMTSALAQTVAEIDFESELGMAFVRALA
jgi:hypothetical protein